jgi:hypothetical protein
MPTASLWETRGRKGSRRIRKYFFTFYFSPFTFFFPALRKKGGKRNRSVSRILFRLRRMLSFICDSHCWLPGSAYPGSYHPPKADKAGRAALSILYMAFQHARFTRSCSYLQKLWALTPHFHLCSASGVVIFCGTVSTSPKARRPAVSRIRCSELSGLSSSPKARR